MMYAQIDIVEPIAIFKGDTKIAKVGSQQVYVPFHSASVQYEPREGKEGVADLMATLVLRTPTEVLTKSESSSNLKSQAFINQVKFLVEKFSVNEELDICKSEKVSLNLSFQVSYEIVDPELPVESAEGSLSLGVVYGNISNIITEEAVAGQLRSLINSCKE